MTNRGYEAVLKTEPLTHIIGSFVIETCHKWVYGSVQLWKKEK
jgi:hypothetical protein